jgi:hypothetical protein
MSYRNGVCLLLLLLSCCSCFEFAVFDALPFPPLSIYLRLFCAGWTAVWFGYGFSFHD